MQARWQDIIPQILLAVQFLTRLPVAGASLYTPARNARAPRWFSLVGLMIGTIGGALLWIFHVVLPFHVALVATIAALVALTGGLHEDGLADSLDGLGGGRTPQRALEIMRDSAIGSYGVLGLGLTLALQIAGLAALGPMGAMVALIAAHGLSRAAMALALGQDLYLRTTGTGTGMEQSLGKYGLAVTGLSVVLALVPAGLVIGPGAALTALIAAAVTGILWRAIYLHRLGGVTGDLLGAMQMLTATGAILGLAVWA